MKWSTSTATRSATAVGVADVNGDKRADLILQYNHEGKVNWQARLAKNETFAYQNANWHTATATASARAAGVCDVDGNGTADLIIQFVVDGRIHWQARTANGNGFSYHVSPPFQTSTATPSAFGAGLGDVDGDGKDDIVIQYKSLD